MESDQTSEFSCEDEDSPRDFFNLTQLNIVANAHFNQPCMLSKLAEGGFHKVYDVLDKKGEPLGAVIRVASSAFPKDKTGSEVATIGFISAHTDVPVPRVYAWNSDRTNLIRGATASKVWDDLGLEKKKVAVGQLAKHLVTLFGHRFDTGGSLYFSSPEPEFAVGPIVIPTFFRDVHNDPRISPLECTSIQKEQNQFRGPFTATTDFLLCQLKAELNFLALHREHAYLDATKDIEKGKVFVAAGEAVLRKALELYPLFPGDMRIYSPMSSPDKPFSICLNDLHPSNVRIDDETGDITGLIDFEGTTTAPTWACATIPGWLLDSDHEESFPSEEPNDVRATLRNAYMDAVRKADPSGEWERAHLTGRPYRYFLKSADYAVVPWGYRDEYVDHQLEWCRAHPGVVYDGPIDPTLPGLDELPYNG